MSAPGTLISTFDSAPGWVSRLVDAGLLVDHPGEGSTPYAVDTRNSASLEFRNVVFEAIDKWVADVRPDFIGAVANSGTLLVAMWAGLREQPFINVLVKGARARGFKRRIEPSVSIVGMRIALLDNHVRTGESISLAGEIVNHAGGEVCAIAACTANPDFEPPFPLHVFFPHHLLLAAHNRLPHVG
jgi:hypothetical protein